MKNILAVDQSYTSCGIVVLNKDIVTHAERFVTDKTLDIFERANQAAKHLVGVANTFDVEYVAIEGLAFSKVGNATRDLAGLQFTIVHELRFGEKYNIRIVSPNAVKKVATGKGNANKELLLEYLPKDALKKFESLGVKKTTGLLDLTDAYWIGRAAQLGIK